MGSLFGGLMRINKAVGNCGLSRREDGTKLVKAYYFLDLNRVMCPLCVLAELFSFSTK